MWWDDFENGLQSTLYLRLVGLVERGYDVQQLHLGVLVQIKHALIDKFSTRGNIPRGLWQSTMQNAYTGLVPKKENCIDESMKHASNRGNVV